jgi:hypothetical protein
MLRAQLVALQSDRHQTVVTDKGMVRFAHELGAVEMRFSIAAQQLPPGTRVVVWWKGGGFLCAAIDELKAEQRETRSVAHSLSAARSRLAAARRERIERLTENVDIVLPA